MDVEQIDLLPCPFCGGIAFMVQEGTHAQCLTPGCCVGPICGLDSWNTRAALTPPEGYVLVPVTWTSEMRSAFVNKTQGGMRNLDDGYVAMLVARPEVPDGRG